MNTVRHFKEFVEELKLLNSRIYKLQVLDKYKNDDIVKYYLDFIFNPYIITGISDKKLNKINSFKSSTIYFKSAKELLEYIRINNTGKDEILQAVFNYIHLGSENTNSHTTTPIDTNLAEQVIQDIKTVQNLLGSIITKNLPLGVDVKTINKVIPNLIPEFNVMLANKYFDKPEIVEGKEFALTTKIDGGRIIAIKKDGQVSFYTRAGQKYEGLVDLE